MVHGVDECAVVQWSGGVLGHKEPIAAVGDDDAVGEQLRVSLQQRQSQLAVQHVRLRVPHSAQVSHHARRVHTPRRHLEPAERGEDNRESPVAAITHCFHVSSTCKMCTISS